MIYLLVLVSLTGSAPVGYVHVRFADIVNCEQRAAYYNGQKVPNRVAVCVPFEGKQ